MIRKNIDLGWKFYRGLPNHGFRLENAADVDLPHDFNVEEAPVPDAPAHAATGYYAGSAATYVKELDIGPEYAGKTVMLEFDGVYMNAVVSLNGQAVCRHNYGYTPFIADITDYIRPGKTNRLQVFVDNTPQPNSRWYSGAGIYRHVDLLVSDAVHIAPWGIYAHTDHIVNGDAFVTVETTVVNDTAKAAKVRLVSSITDENGCVVGETPALAYVPAMSRAVARAMVRIPEVKIWDIDSPELYNVRTRISCGEITDEWQDVFGVRTISVDPVNGFMLNGRSLKLKGGCVHHDNGLLGAESYYDSEYRKLKIQKDGGFNAVRTAHNPPSRDMLLAADRLGMLVLDEAFDCWFNSKSVNDYGRYFEADWEKDMEAFITRDRNHPAIFMWSTGNEIVERGGMSGGYAMAAKLADKVRALDPTRPVLNALCSLWSGLEDDIMEKMREELANAMGGGFIENSNTPFIDSIWMEYTEYFCAPLDVVGYNYLDKRYEMDGNFYPGRVICGTESFGNDFDNVWAHTMAHPYVIGDFTWTSYDYIGEAGIGKSTFHDPDGDIPEAPSHVSAYPWRLGNDADFDICGNGKAQLWFRRVVWGEPDTYIAVQDPKYFGMTESISRWGFEDVTDSWTWPGAEGRDVKVTVYSGADEVELFINGVSAGKKQPERFRGVFDVKYVPGVIEAVSYVDGAEVSRHAIETAGAPARLALIPERTEAPADGMSLIFVNIEVQDADGRRVPGISDVISAEIDGPATLAAFGGADPITEENYSLNIGKTFEGRAQAILRTKAAPGKITLSVKMGAFSADAELISE